MRPFCCENVFDVIVSCARSLRARFNHFFSDTTTTFLLKTFHAKRIFSLFVCAGKRKIRTKKKKKRIKRKRKPLRSQADQKTG